MREKLIELLCEAMQTDDCVGHCNSNCGRVENTADHLIENGVTVREKGSHVKRAVSKTYSENGELISVQYKTFCPFCGLVCDTLFCPYCGADMTKGGADV